MKTQTFDINKMRVASPCSVGWETMTGDERVRRCDSCELNIYNIAEMTKPEVEHLVKTHEGRLCIRLYKRADGTVLTKDCPVSFRAYQKRVARLAGAVLTTILGLFSISFGQNDKPVKEGKIQTIENKNDKREIALSGTIIDPNRDTLPGVVVKLFRKDKYKKNKKKLTKSLISDDKGKFSFNNIETGDYILIAKLGGFADFIGEVTVLEGKETVIDIKLELSVETVVVGSFEPLIDFNSTDITTTVFKRDN